MSATTNLNITKLETAQAQKEVTVNSALDVLDISAGASAKALSGAAVALSETESQSGLLILTGALGAPCDVTIDADISSWKLVANKTTGGQTVQIKYTGSSFVGLTADKLYLIGLVGATTYSSELGSI